MLLYSLSDIILGKVWTLLFPRSYRLNSSTTISHLLKVMSTHTEWSRTATDRLLIIWKFNCYITWWKNEEAWHISLWRYIAHFITLFLERSEVNCECERKMGRRRTWTLTSGGLLYWPFLVMLYFHIQGRTYHFCFSARRRGAITPL